MNLHVLIIAVVLACTCYNVPETTAASIKSLRPKVVLEPLRAKLTLTCVVNISGLAQSFSIKWIVNGLTLSGGSSQAVKGDLRIASLQYSLTQIVTDVPVQCVVYALDSSWKPTVLWTKNSTLTAYGPPEAPSNLTSTQSSSNALILSWSAPSSPVQLHYTVKVNSTTTITVTNDTNITITREVVMAAINSTECDIYSFSVTATNPAGSSIPANHTSSFMLESAPTSVQSDICISNDSSCAVVNYTAYSCTNTADITYTIVVRDQCSDTEVTIDRVSMRDYNIPYTVNCTNITIIAENSLGILEHTVSTTSPDYCTRPVQSVQMCLLVTSSQNLPTRSPVGSISPASPLSLPITITISIVPGVLVLIVVIVSLVGVLLLLYRKLKQTRDSSTEM